MSQSKKQIEATQDEPTLASRKRAASTYRAARRSKMIAAAKAARREAREEAVARRPGPTRFDDGKNRTQECARRLRQRAALAEAA